MQHQTQYYRTVPVTEKPKKDDWYICELTNGDHGEVLYQNGEWHQSMRQGKVIQWLEPIALPDAERLREALKRIKVITDRFSIETMETINRIAREALSAVGDGWIEIKQGCEMPDYGDSVLVIIPKRGGEYFNPFTAKYQGDGFYVKKRRVDDKYFAGEPSHWRPLPPQPINK